MLYIKSSPVAYTSNTVDKIIHISYNKFLIIIVTLLVMRDSLFIYIIISFPVKRKR